MNEGRVSLLNKVIYESSIEQKGQVMWLSDGQVFHLGGTAIAKPLSRVSLQFLRNKDDVHFKR